MAQIQTRFIVFVVFFELSTANGIQVSRQRFFINSMNPRNSTNPMNTVTLEPYLLLSSAKYSIDVFFNSLRLKRRV